MYLLVPLCFRSSCQRVPRCITNFGSGALVLATLPKADRFFLGVESSATGRAWRDRLNERGNALAAAIAQRHGLPDLLARIIAGRGIELDEVEAFLEPSIRRLMPDPYVLTDMEAAADPSGGRDDQR